MKQTHKCFFFCCALYYYVYFLMSCEWLRGTAFSALLSDFQKDLTKYVTPKSGQLLFVIGLFLFYLIVLWIKMSDQARHERIGLRNTLTWRNKCKIILVVLSIAICVLRWGDIVRIDNLQFGMDGSTDIMVFLIGIILAEIVSNRLILVKEDRYLFGYISLAFLIPFLATSSLVHSHIQFGYKYYLQTRWTGLWLNPNTYGLLMGTGLVLACGMAGLRTLWFPRLKIAVCTIAAGMMGVGLWHSYSRGAWLAFVCGLSYLGFHAAPFAGHRIVRGAQWIRLNVFAIAIVLCSVVLFGFWQFQDTEHKVARRLFSIGNMNDFSWRNRVVAWESALTMIADRPCFGFGWCLSEPTHDEYYRTTKVETGATQLNDYFTIGTTLGLPALVCFLWYVGLSFRTNPQEQGTPYDWSRTTCRAGALVLLVGFWFDGGLFKMATSVPFWILLELGSAESPAVKAST